ncbi:Actin cytoskeleton-regulatory complex protein SLA1 [Nakaseomyces bracarensis]|uniref:Actin cytoskeleton-regulatory complex protein SLA1 n=1 Tax=Nakaseomyces bracarensis TaxID=273131 RepID=A0ABR4NTD5_9SACH
MTVFLGVYKAVYSYEPQTPEELEIQEDDLLYLLQKSDVDDWWTVKKRVIGSDVEEPQGLVPSNYIEEAPVISTVKALYDFDQAQNPDEELVFKENEMFDVFDDKDPDWMLVRSQTSGDVGFVPGNYVESAGATAGAVPASMATGSAPAPAPAAVPIAPPVATPATAFAPPPQHADRSKMTPAPEEDDVPPPMPPKQPEQQQYFSDEEEEAPPPKPTRPTSDMPDSSRDRARSRMNYDDYEGADDRRDRDRDRSRGERERAAKYDNYDDEVHTWTVSEVEGRKKHKGKLSIGNNKIIFTPNKGSSQEWTIDKLISYDNEKKHMFLEFKDPYKSFELHTGNNDTCSEIMAIVGEFKGAQRDPGLREVEMATKSSKRGVVLYDFEAESPDELTIRQGDAVYVINDKKSKEWWMVELISNGKTGLVPAQFIEFSKSKESSGLLNSIKKFTTKSPKSSKTRDLDDDDDWKHDAHQDGSKSKGRSRMDSLTGRRKRSSSASARKEYPNPKKSRLWVDRTGTFKVEAQFIGCADGKIHLHKANGVKIAVAAEKLSDEDIIYVERVTGFSLGKFKGKKSDSKESDGDRRRRREQEERDYERKLREREIAELKKARELLDQERSRLQEKDLPPIKPPRPQSGGGAVSSSGKSDYDWFEFFLSSGVDINNCQRYTINFDREKITEDMQPDINPPMLRTLGVREGDIVRIMKVLDKKFNREPLQGTPTGAANMFSEADGSLKINATAHAGELPQQLLPQAPAAQPMQSTQQAPPVGHDDDAWTAKPAATSATNSVQKKTEFTGSMQDLIDLQPLEPKKAEALKKETVPEPQLGSLEPVKTGASNQAALKPAVTGNTTLVPLDPFKTGGNNILPMTTGFVMMPIATGGLMPMQRTGGMTIPMTTFGSHSTGGLIPTTTFGAQLTGGALPLQRTGGLVPLQTTGGALPRTSFNLPPAGSVLPVQKTATGLMPVNTGGALPLTSFGSQLTGGAMPQTSFGAQITGGAMPQTSFGAQITGGAMPQTSFGAQITGGAMPQTSFGAQITGGAMPQTSFGTQPMASSMPPNTFGLQSTGGVIPNMGSQVTGGFQPQSQFGMQLQRTGGLPTNQFTGGAMQPMQQPMSQFTGGAMQPMQQPMNQFTGGAMQPMQPPMNQFTGGAMQQPINQFTGNAMQQPVVPAMGAFNNGVQNITQGMQSTFITQPQQQQPPLQNQPTGFGFGNGPQQAQSQQRQANLFNATASNPFGF